MSSYIKGFGKYLPERVMTNADLEKIVDTTDEWIQTRTGIKERHIAADNESTSDLAYNACLNALSNARLEPEDIDMLFVATVTPDMFFPSTSCVLQEKLKLNEIGACDILAACSGFIYGIEFADALVKTGKYKNIMVVAADILSRITDWTDRNTCVLLGDGAGAAVISNEGGKGEIIDNVLYSKGKYGDLLYIPGGGSDAPPSEDTLKNNMHYLKMNGPEVFKKAVLTMTRLARHIIEKNNIDVKDINLVIPHQANLRIIQAIQARLKLSDEQMLLTVQDYGNTSASSIPIALTKAYEENKIIKNKYIVLVGFGGGFTAGASLIKT